MSRSPAADAQAEALDRLVDAVEARSRRGLAPVVVFDLDDTLFSTAQRHLRILREYAQQEDVRARWREETAALARLKASELKYSIADTATAAGVSRAELIDDLRGFWRARFFSNDYLLADEPMQGAVDYCAVLSRRGARLVYLTGRDEGMRAGTERSLARHGFPTGAETELILKPRFDSPDLPFKTEALERLSGLGVIGAFENEPAHINLFFAAFPEAYMYFVDSKHSGKPVLPHPSVRWISDFRR